MSEIRITSRKGYIRPIGFCEDTGAPKYVIGLKTFSRIRSQLDLGHARSKPLKCGFNLGNLTYTSPRSLRLPLFTPPGIFTVFVKLEIVPADVSALLGLDVIDESQITIDTTVNI